MTTKLSKILCLSFCLSLIACAHYPGGDDDDDQPDAGCTEACPPDGGDPPECLHDDGCPDGQRCDVGTCVPDPECDCTDDCGCGETCVEGACTKTSCCADDDCPEGEVCDIGTGDCGPPSPVCETIRFTQALEGVDGDTTGWSNDDALVDLGASQWSLLGGTATVYGWSDGHPESLTHRGTRGLGVRGQEMDEIDNVCYAEKIKVKFDEPVCIRYVEVRSLFSPDVGGGPTEEGAYELKLGGASLGATPMSGTEAYGSTDGSWSVTLPDVRIDRIDFYVPDDAPATSEFALAAIEVCSCD